MINFLSIVANISTIAMNIISLIKEKIKPSHLFVDNIQIVYNAQILPRYFFLDCIVANNSSSDLSISKASISTLAETELYSNPNTDTKFGNVQMADTIPVLLKPNEAKRLVFEFECGEHTDSIISRIKESQKNRIMLRFYTNNTIFSSRVSTELTDMENWLWSNLDRKKGH